MIITRVINTNMVIAGIGLVGLVINKYISMKKKIKEKNDENKDIKTKLKEVTSLKDKYYLNNLEYHEEIKELKSHIKCYESGNSPYYEGIIKNLENKISIYEKNLSKIKINIPDTIMSPEKSEKCSILDDIENDWCTRDNGDAYYDEYNKMSMKDIIELQKVNASIAASKSIREFRLIAENISYTDSEDDNLSKT